MNVSLIDVLLMCSSPFLGIQLSLSSERSTAVRRWGSIDGRGT